MWVKSSSSSPRPATGKTTGLPSSGHTSRDTSSRSEPDWVRRRKCCAPVAKTDGCASSPTSSSDSRSRIRSRTATSHRCAGCTEASLAICRSTAFDSILYIDVLEHIENDAGEIAEAARRLSLGGYLVVLSPAHNSLFSPFDQAVGHYRRYSRRSLEVLGTRPLSLVKSGYLDSVGILLSFVNRWVLRRSIPTRRNVMAWDRRVIPVSRTLDRYFRFAVGKTVVCVWRRATNA